MEQDRKVNSADTHISVGNSRFDAASGMVTPARGAGVTLRPQTAAVLRVLVASRGLIIPRDRLLSEVWPETNVTEDSVTQCIREIRSALGEDGHRLVRTFPKRGYMLEAQEAAPYPSPSHKALQWIWPAGVALIAGVLTIAALTRHDAPAAWDRPQIIVQPFEDIYRTETWSRIGAGLASELSAALARNDWIDVRQSAGAEPSGDGYLLTGTIGAGADMVRMTAKLTKQEGGEILWSEVWTGRPEEIFDIQSSVLEKTEATIASGWTGAIARDRMQDASAPRHVGAFDLYLRAIEQKHLFTPEALAQAQRTSNRQLSWTRIMRARGPRLPWCISCRWRAP